MRISLYQKVHVSVRRIGREDISRFACLLTESIATVQKILTEIIPQSEGLATSKDFRDALTDCCVEFITLIASEANEISDKEAKKTIACEHVTAALKELGFDEYIAPVLETAEEFKRQQAVRLRRLAHIAT